MRLFRTVEYTVSSYWVSRLDWTLAWVEIPSRRWKSFKLISKPSEEQKIYSTRSCKCALANEAEIISQIALCKIEWSFLGDRYRVIRKEDVFVSSSKAANSLWLIFQIGKWKIVKHRRGVTILIFSEKNHLKKVYASLGMWNVNWFELYKIHTFVLNTFSSKFLRGIWAEAEFLNVQKEEPNSSLGMHFGIVPEGSPEKIPQLPTCWEICEKLLRLLSYL